MAEQRTHELGKPTLVHLAHSMSQTVMWCLEELEVDYNLRTFDRPTDMLAEGLYETHVQGHSPQLILASGGVLTQTPAILKYLILTYDKGGRFHDPRADVAAQVRELYLVNLGGMDLAGRAGTMKVSFLTIEARSPIIIKQIFGAIRRQMFSIWLDREVENIFKVLEDELREREWLMDTEGPSVPDFLILFGVEMFCKSGFIDLEKWESVKAFRERCLVRKAWKKALEKGNGFDLDFIARAKA